MDDFSRHLFETAVQQAQTWRGDGMTLEAAEQWARDAQADVLAYELRRLTGYPSRGLHEDLHVYRMLANAQREVARLKQEPGHPCETAGCAGLVAQGSPWLVCVSCQHRYLEQSCATARVAAWRGEHR